MYTYFLPCPFIEQLYEEKVFEYFVTGQNWNKIKNGKTVKEHLCQYVDPTFNIRAWFEYRQPSLYTIFLSAILWGMQLKIVLWNQSYELQSSLVFHTWIHYVRADYFWGFLSIAYNKGNMNQLKDLSKRRYILVSKQQHFQCPI